MVTTHPASPSAPTRPPLLHVASVECQCGTVHHCADGRVPVGWTVSRGAAFCTDCTTRGIPARLIIEPRAAQPKQADTPDRARLRGEAIALLVKGTQLMPLSSKQRVSWIKSVNKMLDTMCQRAA